jgi:hypothetical protein
MYSELTAYRPTTWGKLPFFIRKLFTRNFEEGMQLMIETDEFSPHIPLLMRDMAEYLCEFTPASNSNLYVRLLNEIKPSVNNITFSSLFFLKMHLSNKGM